jgi:hypothetical protein
MSDLIPCPRDDCKSTVDHWHGSNGTARCCQELMGEQCDHCPGALNDYACYAPHDQHSTTDAADLLATVQDAIARDWAPCPLCQGHVRQTVGLVCQLCGHDYRPDPDAALVETMAKATLKASFGDGSDWDEYTGATHTHYREVARAALAAYRQATA